MTSAAAGLPAPPDGPEDTSRVDCVVVVAPWPPINFTLADMFGAKPVEREEADMGVPVLQAALRALLDDCVSAGRTETSAFADGCGALRLRWDATAKVLAPIPEMTAAEADERRAVAMLVGQFGTETAARVLRPDIETPPSAAVREAAMLTARDGDKVEEV